MNQALQRSEYDRMSRVIDMMLSGHSLLRDRYRRRSTGLTILVMAFSLTGIALAFISPMERISIGPLTGPLSVWLGAFSVAVFFLSIVELVVDWRRKAWAHADAAQRLGALKGRFRGAAKTDDGVDSEGVDLKGEYEQTMAAIVEISERQFLSIKVKHQRKMAVSRMADAHPGAPLVFIYLLALVQGFRSQGQEGNREGSPENDR